MVDFMVVVVVEIIIVKHTAHYVGFLSATVDYFGICPKIFFCWHTARSLVVSCILDLFCISQN